jgi:hypothetical protein
VDQNIDGGAALSTVGEDALDFGAGGRDLGCARTNGDR